MKKPMIITIMCLVVLFGGIFGWNGMRAYFINKYFANFVPPPKVISVAIAKVENWQPSLDATGSLSAKNGVDLSPEVSGQIKAIHFRSGEYVKRGESLIQLDDSVETAQLKDAQAQLQLAQINDERTKKLFAQGASTQSSVDDSSSKLKQLQANTENIRAQIAKKLIRAPFSGKIGINQVNVGQYISAGFSCASLQSSHTLKANFSLSQQDISKVKLNQVVLATSDTYPNIIFNGIVTAVNSKVDDDSRTLEVEATIENPEDKLLPGMFVNLQLLLSTIPDSVILPQTAITYSLYGQSAFIVTLSDKKTDAGEQIGKVKRISVQTGDKKASKVLILDGIKAGEMVVDSGQLKLNDGDSVAINNSVQL